ncbi:hypothetical protein HHK36_017367 [Tetracentron sinense]|uniref:Ubiquitin thioesterase OTU n=1 Tax=Tetracentron sinense TaxID=13715 RepID=A0A834Z2N6_TETSI|nr:hypothetical protein HHK36_017367 [Tetracentron sinense]
MNGLTFVHYISDGRPWVQRQRIPGRCREEAGNTMSGAESCACTSGYANMLVCSPISPCAKGLVRLSERVGKQMSGHVSCVVFQSPSSSCCFYFHSGHSQPKCVVTTVSRTFSCSSVIGSQGLRRCSLGSGFSKLRTKWHPLTPKNLQSSTGHKTKCFAISSPCQNMSLRLSVPKQGRLSKIRWNVGPASWPQRSVSAGLIFGLFVCFSSSEPVYAEAMQQEKDKDDDCDSTLVSFSHGKKVYTDYSITGIPGDGRCLFRSVAHGACLRSGKPSPSESLQRELADELRARVADEFIKRRVETEWFVEGNFDTYVSHMRKPHVWGGEPELFMASHVLQMPITVYMYDEDSRGLITIAEYGQEYGKEDPIRILYHGFGHYDALQIPGNKGGKSRL